MTVLKRIRQIVAANINHLLEKAEDPEKMIKQLIREMDQNIISLRMEVAKAIAAEKRLVRRADETEAQVAKRQKHSEKAAGDGNDDLAREAIGKRMDAERSLRDLRDQVRKAAGVSETMKKELGRLEDKIQEARRRKEILIARKRRAEAQKEMLKSSEEFRKVSSRTDGLLAGTTDAGTRMDSIEDAVLEMETDAEARREVLESSQGTEEALDKEQRREAIEKELDSVKKRVKGNG